MGLSDVRGQNITKVSVQKIVGRWQSFDNCADHVFFKAIRMEELLGTNNGSTRDNTVSCNGLNGDDDFVLAGQPDLF